MALISVIIPIYKGEAYLPATLDSVLAQTHPDLEVLCIDDASPDNSADIVQEYAKKDKRVIYHKHAKNMGGPAFARNTGLKLAKGEWVAFIDQDDLWEPTKLADQLSVAIAENVDFLCCNIFLLNNQTNKIDGEAWGAVRGEPKKGFARRLLQGNFVPPASTFIRRQVFDRVGYFDTTLKGVDDFDMWYRIVRQFPATILNKPLATWRYRNANSISYNDALMVNDELRFYEKIVQGKEWEGWEKEIAKEGVRRNQKFMANRLLLAGKYQEAQAMYSKAGVRKILPFLQVAPWLVRMAYTIKRSGQSEFQPLELVFPS